MSQVHKLLGAALMAALSLATVAVSGDPATALQRRHVPDRHPGAEPTGVLEEDAHADATRDGRPIESAVNHGNALI